MHRVVIKVVQCVRVQRHYISSLMIRLDRVDSLWPCEGIRGCEVLEVSFGEEYEVVMMGFW